ncbi:hypothetical protein Javan273_0029 [Streptococcus phage Javan273]|nr:hypothetical protein Javan273_0029 [Streptococcus phage Javan273]
MTKNTGVLVTHLDGEKFYAEHIDNFGMIVGCKDKSKAMLVTRQEARRPLYQNWEFEEG